MHGRLNGFFAWQCNRCRRQAADGIGIIRCWRAQILPGIACIFIAHAVNDGRVNLQAHAQLQAAREHPGNLLQLAVQAGLFLQSTP